MRTDDAEDSTLILEPEPEPEFYWLEYLWKWGKVTIVLGVGIVAMGALGAFYDFPVWLYYGPGIAYGILTQKEDTTAANVERALLYGLVAVLLACLVWLTFSVSLETQPIRIENPRVPARVLTYKCASM